MGFQSGARYLAKALRVGIWTLSCLILTVFGYLLIYKPRGTLASIKLLLSVDPFLIALVLFICVIAAFIIDLWYVSRYD